MGLPLIVGAETRRRASSAEETENVGMLNPLHAGRGLGDVELAAVGAAPPRTAARTTNPGPPPATPRPRPLAWWRRALSYEGAPQPPEAPLEATFYERVAHARRYPFHHARAVASIHCSIVAWCGLWDLVTYCGLATTFPRDVPRNAAWVALGLATTLGVDAFHGNAAVPGSVGGRVATFWAGDVGLGMRWCRALASFAAQVLLTCGLYNLVNDHLFPKTFARDLWYAVAGLTTTAAVDASLAYAELVGRDRAPTKRATGWDLSFGGPTQRPGVAATLACVSYAGQVATWVGFDNCLCVWPSVSGVFFIVTSPARARIKIHFRYSGVWRQSKNPDCFWGCVFGRRRYFHQLPLMALGVGLLFWTGSLLHFGGVADRFDADAHPRVQAWLPAPRGPSVSPAFFFGVRLTVPGFDRYARSKLWGAFARSVLAQAGYYAHLTAFWYLVDEDVDTSFDVDLRAASEDRNAIYLGLGLGGLYASGTFWADAGA